MHVISRAVPAALLGLALLPALAAVTSSSPASAAARPTCQGLRATIVGTPRNDRIRGTPGRDVIVGLGGNDRIRAGGGNDVVCGGDGADRLEGGPGRDKLYGERGQFTGFEREDDTLAPNVLDGGPGRDLLDIGTDSRSGGYAVGVLNYRHATAGLVLDLGDGRNGTKGTATVGGDRDRVVVRRSLKIMGTPFADTITGSRFADEITGGPGPDTVNGGAGDDFLAGDDEGRKQAPDDDVVDGGPGNDEVYGTFGSDTLHGGPGDDTVESDSGAASRLYGDDGQDDLTLTFGSAPGYVIDGGAGYDVSRIVSGDSVPVGTALTMRVLEGTIAATDGDGAVLGRVAGLERISFNAVLRWSYYGSDAADDVEGGQESTPPGTIHPLRAWTYGGDDSVTGTYADDVIDTGDGRDAVDAKGGADTCLNVEVTTSCEKLTP